MQRRLARPKQANFTRGGANRVAIWWTYSILDFIVGPPLSLHWRHNKRNGASNHRCLDNLLNRLFTRISKKTSKLCTIGLCEGTPPVTGGFPSQRASNSENVSIWWRHHDSSPTCWSILYHLNGACNCTQQIKNINKMIIKRVAIKVPTLKFDGNFTSIFATLMADTCKGFQYYSLWFSVRVVINGRSATQYVENEYSLNTLELQITF